MVLSADEVPHDDTERVLEAAFGLFYARGVQAVGMDAIRDASGVSLKRLYKLFPAKDALVEATLRQRERTVRAHLAQATDAAGETTPRERILAVFDLLGTWLAAPDYRGCEFINAFGELGGTNARVAALARAHKRSWNELFAALVKEAGGPPRLADQLALLVNGAMVSAAIVGGPTTAADAKAAAAVLLAAELPPEGS